MRKALVAVVLATSMSLLVAPTATAVEPTPPNIISNDPAYPVTTKQIPLTVSQKAAGVSAAFVSDRQCVVSNGPDVRWAVVTTVTGTSGGYYNRRVDKAVAENWSSSQININTFNFRRLTPSGAQISAINGDPPGVPTRVERYWTFDTSSWYQFDMRLDLNLAASGDLSNCKILYR